MQLHYLYSLLRHKVIWFSVWALSRTLLWSACWRSENWKRDQSWQKLKSEPELDNDIWQPSEYFVSLYCHYHYHHTYHSGYQQRRVWLSLIFNKFCVIVSGKIWGKINIYCIFVHKHKVNIKEDINRYFLGPCLIAMWLTSILPDVFPLTMIKHLDWDFGFSTGWWLVIRALSFLNMCAINNKIKAILGVSNSRYR